VKHGKGGARARPSSGEAPTASNVRVRYLSCGDTAFTVEFANEVSPDINGRVIALHAAIGRARAAGQLAGLVETVPTMRSLMVTYDPLLTSRATLQPAIEGMIEHGLATEGSSRDVTIPCCYDDPDFAPDLQEIAEAMASKNKLQHKITDWTPITLSPLHLSGADIESIIIRARRAARQDGRGEVTAADLKKVAEEFTPARDELAVEYQELVAAREATSRAMLPARFRDLSSAELSRRIEELRPHVR